MKGLWIDQNTFVNFAEQPSKSLSSEIATRSRSIDFQALGMYLPNPDPVLKKQGKDIAVYRDLLVDDRVRGSWGNRKAATLSLEWEIDRGQRGKVKGRQAKVIEELFGRLDVMRIVGEILQARLFGFQPLEVLWERRDGLLLPRDVVGKPQEWFVFGPEANELRFRTKSNWTQGEELPARSFLCATSEASYANPYGEALLASCFWPVTFKKGGWRFWVTFAEKYGQAFAVGKIRRGADKKEMDQLAEMLEAMIQDAIAVIYDDSSVDLKAVDGKGTSAELFRGIIAEANSAISTVLLGHAGAGQSTSGTLGGEDAAINVRDDFKSGDKKLVNAAFNQLIAWIGEINWGGGPLPTFSLWEEEDVDKDQAERDDKLTSSLDKSGLKLTRAYYQRTYNLEESDLEEKGAAALPAADFAEGEIFPDQAALDAAIASLTPEELRAQMEAVLMPLIAQIRAGESYETILAALAAAEPTLPVEQLQERLARAIFVAEVWGRLSAQGEAGA